MSEPREPFVDAGAGDPGQGTVFDQGSDPTAAGDPFAAWMDTPPTTEQPPATQAAPKTPPASQAASPEQAQPEPVNPSEPPVIPPPQTQPPAEAPTTPPPSQPPSTAADQVTDGGQMMLGQVDDMEKKNLMNSFAAKFPVLSYNGGLISADTVTASDLEASEIVARKLLAQRVCACEIHVAESMAVSCCLKAQLVEAGKLTVAMSEIGELRYGEVVNLSTKRHGLLGTLAAPFLRGIWTSLTCPAPRSR